MIDFITENPILSIFFLIMIILCSIAAYYSTQPDIIITCRNSNGDKITYINQDMGNVKIKSGYKCNKEVRIGSYNSMDTGDMGTGMAVGLTTGMAISSR